MIPCGMLGIYIRMAMYCRPAGGGAREEDEGLTLGHFAGQIYYVCTCRTEGEQRGLLGVEKPFRYLLHAFQEVQRKMDTNIAELFAHKAVQLCSTSERHRQAGLVFAAAVVKAVLAKANYLFTCPLASMRCHFALWLIILFRVVAIVPNAKPCSNLAGHTRGLPGSRDMAPPHQEDLRYFAHPPGKLPEQAQCSRGTLCFFSCNDSTRRWRRWRRNSWRGRYVEGVTGSSHPSYRRRAGVFHWTVRRRGRRLLQGNRVCRRQGSRHHSHQSTCRHAR